MTGRMLKYGKSNPHKCDLPELGPGFEYEGRTVGVGAIWQCECGKYWIAIGLDEYQMNGFYWSDEDQAGIRHQSTKY